MKRLTWKDGGKEKTKKKYMEEVHEFSLDLCAKMGRTWNMGWDGMDSGRNGRRNTRNECKECQISFWKKYNKKTVKTKKTEEM